jgi:hypothetical protein
MLFFISGSDGSIGYSFFSDVKLTAVSVNLGVAPGEHGDPFSFDEKGAAERGLDELTDAGREQSSTDPSEALSERSSSRIVFTPPSLGGTTITSTGRFPLASTQLISAPADRSSFTASTALTEPPEAAQ